MNHKAEVVVDGADVVAQFIEHCCRRLACGYAPAKPFGATQLIHEISDRAIADVSSARHNDLADELYSFLDVLTIKFVWMQREIQFVAENFLASRLEPLAGFFVGRDAGHIIYKLFNPCAPCFGFGLDCLDIKTHVKVRLKLARDVTDCQSYKIGVVE